MTRTQAWQNDKKFIAAKHRNITGQWRVVGNDTWFIYKNKLTEEEAIAYASELNKNKKQSLTYSI